MLELRSLALSGLLASLSLACAAGSRSPADCAPPPDLAVMQQVGEAVRAAYPHDLDATAPEAVRAADRIMLVDRQNTARLRPWLRRCGWPDSRSAGEATEGRVWVLVQHADQDRPFQQIAIGLLKRRVLQGGAPAIHLAYLEDRVAIGMGQAQRYGTQVEMKGACSIEPLPVDHPTLVDSRRKAVGMEPLATYLAHVRASLLPPHCSAPERATP